jgi:hypothetical protein
MSVSVRKQCFFYLEIFLLDFHIDKHIKRGKRKAEKIKEE